MVLVEDVNALLTQVTALGLSIISVVGVGLKFAMSRSHNPRLVALETKADKYDQEIGGLLQTVNDHKTQILNGVAVAEKVVPQLTQVDQAQAAQIAALEKQLADLNSKVNLVSTVIPAVTPTENKQPVQ